MPKKTHRILSVPYIFEERIRYQYQTRCGWNIDYSLMYGACRHWDGKAILAADPDEPVTCRGCITE